MATEQPARSGGQPGSGNVFADLGLDDADDLFARSQLGYHVHRLISARGLEQKEIATLLDIKRPEVSHLMNGHFSRFTADNLLDFLKRLDQRVEIQIRPRRPGESHQEVRAGA